MTMSITGLAVPLHTACMLFAHAAVPLHYSFTQSALTYAACGVQLHRVMAALLMSSLL